MSRPLIVDVDDQVLSWLAAAGEPAEVLAKLARSAASGVRLPNEERRHRTNESLRVEREKTDSAVGARRDADEDAADQVIKTARDRADAVAEAYRKILEPQGGVLAAAGDARAAATNDERAAADDVLEEQRNERRRSGIHDLTSERKITDEDLGGERAEADDVLVDQRAANEQLIRTTIRAHELAEAAEEAKERAVESERELRVVSEFREMFIGILGHDLRTPLSSIVMAAALLLRRGNLDEQDAEMVTRIVRSSQRVTRMVSQLLDLTRARLGGGFPLDISRLDLQVTCQNVVDELGANVELDARGDLTGHWDDDRLTEVLVNLVGNAIEHATLQTTVTLWARTDGDDVVVEVRNQGAPISPNVLPFLFEPFRRGRPHEKTALGHLGLGLYIAHEIVVAHGGTLDARSSDGTTTFAVRLPRRTN